MKRDPSAPPPAPKSGVWLAPAVGYREGIKRKWPLPLMEGAVLLAYLMGVLLTLQDGLKIPMNFLTVTAAVFFGVFFTAVYNLRQYKRYALLSAGLLFVLACALFWKLLGEGVGLFRQRLVASINQYYYVRFYAPSVGPASDFALPMLELVSLFALAAMIGYAIVSAKSWIVLLAAAAPFAWMAINLGAQPHLLPGLLFLLAVVSLYAMHRAQGAVCEKEQKGAFSAPKHRRLRRMNRLRFKREAMLKGGVSVAAVSLAVLLAANAAFPRDEYEWNEGPKEFLLNPQPMFEQLGNEVTGWFQGLDWNRLLPGSVEVGGGVNGGQLGGVGEIKYQNTVKLELSGFSEPHAMYLKGFVGSEYTAREWRELPDSVYRDSALFDELAEREYPAQLLPQQFFSDFGSELESRVSRFSIRNVAAGSRFAYLPYFLAGAPSNQPFSYKDSGWDAAVDGRRLGSAPYSVAAYFIRDQAFNEQQSQLEPPFEQIEFRDLNGAALARYEITSYFVRENKGYRRVELAEVPEDWDGIRAFLRKTELYLPLEGDGIARVPRLYFTVGDGYCYIENDRLFRVSKADYDSYLEQVDRLAEPYGQEYLDITFSPRVQEIIAENEIWEYRMQRDYAAFVQEHYLALPETGLERFKQDYNAKRYAGMELSGIVETVRSDLAGRCSYSLSPGQTPAGADFVEDFLYSRHKGFCVHFATAAVLMFRAAGVPARYVEGYIVRSEDYSDARDGVLPIRDTAAHAWPEIYVEPFGWFPVEVTPGFSGGAASRPGLSESSQVSSIPVSSVPVSSALSSEPSSQALSSETVSSSVSSKPTATGPAGLGNRGRAGLLFGTAAGLLLMALLLVLLRRKLTVRRREKAFRQADRNRAAIAGYHYLEKLLAFEGVVPREGQTPQEFAVAAEEACGFLEAGSFVRATELALAARFGGRMLDRSELSVVLSLARRLDDKIYGGSGPWNRLRYKYFAGLR